MMSSHSEFEWFYVKRIHFSVHCQSSKGQIRRNYYYNNNSKMVKANTGKHALGQSNEFILYSILEKF